MRPKPKARHLVVMAIFVAVSVIAHFHATMEDRMTDEQIGVAVNVVRSLDGQLYARDPVFGGGELWRFQTPLWQGYLREAYCSTGRRDIRLPLVALIGPLVFVYLAGMYALLWRQCRSWAVACTVAVLSTAVITVAGGHHWGLGPLSSMTGDTVYLAFIPLLIWAFVTRVGRPSVLWVFLAAGLLGNVHAVTAMNLTLVLAIAVIGHWRFSWRGWALAILGGLCSAGAASPQLWYYFTQRAALASTRAVDWSIVGLALRHGKLAVLFPDMLGKALEFPSLAYSLGLWIPAVAVMLRPERFRVRDLRMWGWLLGAGLGVGLILHGASQLVGVFNGSPPPVIDFVHAIRFTLLPLYVLLAQGIVHLLRLGVSQHAIRLALAALMAVWLVPADNLAVPRHWVEEAVTATMAEENRPENVQKRLIRRDRHRELRAIGHWLETHTPVDTVVVCQEAPLRLWSRRSLVACRADLKYFYYLAPDRLKVWAEQVADQAEVLRPRTGQPAEPAAVERFARRYGADFVVLRAGRPAKGDRRRWVSSPTGAWGKHWRLFRVHVASG